MGVLATYRREEIAILIYSITQPVERVERFRLLFIRMSVL